MSSTAGSDFQRMIACEEQLSKAGPSPRSHKRTDSKDFVGIGGLFRPPTPQTSWPTRPPLDEFLQDTTLSHPNVDHHAQDHVPPSGHGPEISSGSRDAPTVPSPPPARSRDTQCISKEDAAHLIHSRDALRQRKDPNGQRTESSASSVCESPPSITEDDEPGTQTPRDGNRTPINASRPATPPYHSVATTESGYDSDGKGPVSPQPWSTNKGHKRKRSNGDDI